MYVQTGFLRKYRVIFVLSSFLCLCLRIWIAPGCLKNQNACSVALFCLKLYLQQNAEILVNMIFIFAGL